MTRRSSLALSLPLLGVLANACNVPAPPKSTGGVGDAGVDGDASASASCSRGLVIVLSDFVTTNVALTDADGTTTSASFLSSGAAVPGLSLALSGDVVVPTDSTPSGRVVLIDRYGTNVLTWADPASARVLGQLAVGTGFESNPQDYVEIDATHAYVSRYETNSTPGKQPFDQGGDVLVVDTHAFAIASRIAMPTVGTYLPRPGGMTLAGNDVVVALGELSADFSSAADGELLGIDVATNAIDWQLTLTGLSNCDHPVLSPSGKTMAVACSGVYDSASDTFDVTHSDVALFDVTVHPPVPQRRLGLAAKANAGLQNVVAFASETLVLATSFGKIDGSVKDALWSVDLTTNAATQVVQATKGGLQFGALRCLPGCGDICFLAGADTSQLRRWHVSGATLTPLSSLTVDTTIGLPPRGIGGF